MVIASDKMASDKMMLDKISSGVNLMAVVKDCTHYLIVVLGLLLATLKQETFNPLVIKQSKCHHQEIFLDNQFKAAF